MVNRLFTSMSQASGIALAATVVGMMSFQVHGGVADAGIGTRAVATDGQGASARAIVSDTTKADFVPGMSGGNGHPHV